MDFWKRKRKIAAAAALLLCFMLLCTLISKSVYAHGLPQITAEEAKKKTLGRQIRVTGTVMQSREYAVSTLPAIRVESVEVGKGDEVEEGALLFTLDMQDLREQIAQQELAVKKLEVQIAALEYNQQLADGKKVRDTDRLLEDYLDAAEENDIAVDRARIKEAEAQQDLQEHLEDAPQLTDSEGREAAEKEYEDWKERTALLQEEETRLTKELAAAQKRVEEAQAALDEAKRAAQGAGTQFSSEKILSADGVPESADDSAAALSAPVDAAKGLTADGSQPAPADSSQPAPTAEEPENAGAEAPEETNDPEAPEDGAAGPSGSDGMEPPDDSGNVDEPDDSGNAGEPPATNEPSGPDALQKRLDEAAAERDALAAELENIQEKLQRHLSEEKTEPDFSAEDAEQKSWEAQRETLERSVESADWAYDDALRQREKALEEAQRKVDDSVEAEELQDTLALNQLELSWQKEVLKGYQELQNQEGKITAAQKGVVTAVYVTPGSDTPDGAAVVYADKEENLEFQMSLTKEEKKYVNMGTQGSLLLGNSQETCEVTYMELQPDGSYLAVLSLPEGMGNIGESGTFTVVWQSQAYQRCIPVGALQEENQRKYVYVVRRQQGILGEELAAEKRFVTVLEQGDAYAALDQTDLSDGEEVIITSTKALTDGDIVRYRLADE